MTRPERALQYGGEAGNLDKSVATGTIHFLNVWQKHGVGAFRFQQRQIARFVAWVGRQILIGAKLGGIDEDGCHDTVSLCRAMRTRPRWPSCRYPMVGTTPTVSPARFQRRTASRISALVRQMIICFILPRPGSSPGFLFAGAA